MSHLLTPTDIGTASTTGMPGGTMRSASGGAITITIVTGTGTMTATRTWAGSTTGTRSDLTGRKKKPGTSVPGFFADRHPKSALRTRTPFRRCVTRHRLQCGSNLCNLGYEIRSRLWLNKCDLCIGSRFGNQVSEGAVKLRRQLGHR